MKGREVKRTNQQNIEFTYFQVGNNVFQELQNSQFFDLMFIAYACISLHFRAIYAISIMVSPLYFLASALHM